MAIQLPCGCSATDVWASPENWKSLRTKKSLDLNWYVQCKFFDPLYEDKYPNGFPFRKKVNRFKTLEERKAAIEILMEEIPKKLSEGFNPITKKFMLQDQEENFNTLHPDLNTNDAIEFAWENILATAKNNKDKKVKRPFNDVRVAKNRFKKGLKQLRYNTIPINEFKTSQARETLDHLNIPDAYYNKFLSYLSKIFTELIEYGCIEHNPFKLFKKRKPVKKIRKVMTEEMFWDIMSWLNIHNYNFYRYSMIFHYSGARSTELMMVQKKDVDISNQEYRALIKKGNQYVEEIKVILLDAVPLWEEVLSECTSENDYLFSNDLEPGRDAISATQISRRWNRWIKKRYAKEKGVEIEEDFYTSKHLFLDKVDAANQNTQINFAQSLASHRTSIMTDTVYLINKKKREREALKKLSVK